MGSDCEKDVLPLSCVSRLRMPTPIATLISQRGLLRRREKFRISIAASSPDIMPRLAFYLLISDSSKYICWKLRDPWQEVEDVVYQKPTGLRNAVTET